AYDDLATALDDGERVLLGVVPAVDQTPRPEERLVVDRVLRFLDMLGLDPDEVGDQLVLTPACGLAGASASYAREALALARTGAARLAGG
ncbi:MAG TPA: methionine synthase, partial [Marmoricola sp.]|nr:methionine synthase [Marmoricola sp.]